MTGRITTDQIFTMKEMASKYCEYNRDPKAYEGIDRRKSWSLMKKFMF